MSEVKKIHILHVNTNVEWGGGEYQVLHLLLGLRDRGYRVTLGCSPGSPLCERAEAAGLNVEGIQQIESFLKQHRPELLHLHDSRAVDISVKPARRLGIPAVFSRRIASPLRMNWFSRRKYAARNIAAMLAISETVKDVLRRSAYPIERVHVVPSGLDFDALAAAEPDPALRALAGDGLLAGGLGKLSEKKNWAFMLQVAQAAKAAGLNITWILAGEGPEQENLERLMRSLGLEDPVHLLGFRSDGTRVLTSLDLLFFPSRMEGASVTIREAMVLGKPVIAVDAAGSVESLGGHGWVVRDGAVADAVGHLQAIAAGGEAVQQQVAAARASALDRFSMRGTIEGTIRVYEAVLGAKRPD
ncbi:MAG: glycosyltransferase involved in cell wall biosynthesis [Kiritimatiellia bacterium]|jgi:glycosyltransferase involved in cell wall biosynthesis